MEAIIDIEDMIGAPFKKGGRDLVTGVDCFGVLMECHRRVGKVIPDFRSPEFYHEIEAALNANKVSWRKWWDKNDGGEAALALCQPGRSLHFHIAKLGADCHVGYIYKPGWFIHAWEGTNGVTAERINLWKQRIVGIYEFNG
jgi:cell wall-associated NlpC family hydrolase